MYYRFGYVQAGLLLVVPNSYLSRQDLLANLDLVVYNNRYPEPYPPTTASLPKQIILFIELMI